MLQDKKGKVLVKHSYLVQHQLPWHNQFRKFPFLYIPPIEYEENSAFKNFHSW